MSNKNCPFCGHPFNSHNIHKHYIGEVLDQYTCPGCHMTSPILCCGGLLEDWWNDRKEESDTDRKEVLGTDRCPKCGRSDLHLLYYGEEEIIDTHRKIRDKSKKYINEVLFDSGSIWYITATKEFISYHCRTCQYYWEGPVKKEGHDV